MTSGVKNSGFSAQSTTGFPMQSSPTPVLGAEQTVKKTITFVMDGLRQFLKVHDGTRIERSVVVLGCTGAGKTALINLIAGRQLCTLYDRNDDRTTLDVADPMEDFLVGNHTLSETTIPHKWVDSNGVAFWDCPGFYDNRGTDQEIVNAVCVRKIFDVSDQTKLLIVVKDSDLDDSRCEDLRDFVHLLQDDFLSNVTEISKKVTLVVSQAPMYRTVEHVKSRMEEFKDELIEVSEINLLSALQACPIAIFNKPADGKMLREGERRPLDLRKTKESIFSHVNSIQYSEKREVNLGLSERGRQLAHESATALGDQIKEDVRQLMEDFGRSIQSIVTSSTNQECLESLLEKLELLKPSDDSNLVYSLIEKCDEIAHECGQLLRPLLIPLEKLKILERLEDILHSTSLNKSELVRIIQEKVNMSVLAVHGALIGIKARTEAEKAAEEHRLAEESEKKAQVAKERAETTEKQKNVAEAANQVTQTKLREEEAARQRAQQVEKVSVAGQNVAEIQARDAEERRRTIEEERWAADKQAMALIGLQVGCKVGLVVVRVAAEAVCNACSSDERKDSDLR